MPADPQMLALLASIDASLRTLVEIAQKRRPAQTSDDAICNGPHGDPVVKAKDPRDWTGDSMKGRNFSECPPDYLDLLAERFDYFASRDTDDTKQKYNMLDARRARAWAARIRSGWKSPVTERVNEAETEPRW